MARLLRLGFIGSILFSFFVLSSAGAQTASAPTTSTTQFASGVTTPGGGLILSGTATNPNTGHAVRFFWSSDSANGLCRLDPDVDTAGPHTLNANTCLRTVVGGVRFLPGQLAFDPATNNIYAIDAAQKLGVFRIHYLPSADVGNGLLDQVNQEILGGSGTGGTAVGGCGIPSNVPFALALGPDANLYVGSRRSGSILRIVAPQTQPLPCGNVQTIGATADGKKDTGLAWLGHNLYGGDGIGPWVINNADQCFTAANNFAPCKGATFLGAQVNLPLGLSSDQIYPSTTGSVLYYLFASSITRVDGATTTTPTATPQYGGPNFPFLGAAVADPTDPAGEALYAGDDPANGAPAGQGLWLKVSPATPPPPPPPAIPGTPTNVTATGGDSQAKVSWTPAQDGVTVASYTVHNSSASNGVLAQDVIVQAAQGATAPPTSTTITGLTNGVTYQFEVAASNSNGTSAFSAPSNSVTPQVQTVPGAPTNVVASAGNASAQVAWTAPADTGGSALTSNTVTALINGVPSGITASAAGNATGVLVTGLTNNTTYTFTVHATNAVGNGPESAPSTPVTPTAPVTPDTGISMTGSASVAFAANATYTLAISNAGPSTAPEVVVTDNIPAGSTFVSQTTSQGSCLLSGATLTCNLGAMAAGGTATVTVTLTVNAQITNTASVQSTDASGAVLTDPNPANNSSSVTTALSTPQTTTDIQVVGAAQNGGPAVGNIDTYTWQVHNSGSQVANAVQFSDTLPPSLRFASVSTNVGTCSGPPAGSAGGAVSCSVASLAVGQAMVITMNVTVSQAGSISNTGHATFNGTDTNAANNSFTVIVNAK